MKIVELRIHIIGIILLKTVGKKRIRKIFFQTHRGMTKKMIAHSKRLLFRLEHVGH